MLKYYLMYPLMYGNSRKHSQVLMFFLFILFKDKWIGLLHHVCNSHDWLYGKCDHEDQAHDPNLPWFDRRDVDYTQTTKDHFKLRAT